MLTNSSLISCICSHPKYQKNTFVSRAASFEVIGTIRKVFGIPKGVPFTIFYKQKYESGQTRMGEVHKHVWDAVAAIAEEILVAVGDGEIEMLSEEELAEEDVEEEISETPEPELKPKEPKPSHRYISPQRNYNRNNFAGRRKQFKRRLKRGEKCDHCIKFGESCRLDTRSKLRVKCWSCRDAEKVCTFENLKRKKNEKGNERGSEREERMSCEDEDDMEYVG